MWQEQWQPKASREITAFLEPLDFLGQLDHQDPKEKLVSLDDQVVQACWGLKERKGTPMVYQDLLDLPDPRAGQEYSAAQEEQCSPSLPDPGAKCLFIQMEQL